MGEAENSELEAESAIQRLLQNAEIRAQFEPVLKFLAQSENPELAAIKKQVVEIASELAELGKKKKENVSKKDQKEARSARNAIRERLTELLLSVKPQVEKLAAAERLDPNPTVEEFLRKNRLTDSCATIEGDHYIEVYFFVAGEGYSYFEIKFSAEVDNARELIERISQKRYELNVIDFVKKVGKCLDSEDESVICDAQKLELYFAELEEHKQKLRENPDEPNDLGFLETAVSLRRDRAWLKINFRERGRATASVDLGDYERLKFSIRNQENKRDRIKKVEDEIRDGPPQFRIALLNEAVLDIDYDGKGSEYGHDKLSLEISLERAEKFLAKFEKLKEIRSARVGFGKKDERKEKPFLRLSTGLSEHKNIFPDGIRFSDGKFFDGTTFFPRFSVDSRLEGCFPMDYFFATATKVELVESEDSRHPDKFKIEVDWKKHEKWVAENLSNPK